jgi:hypothetical protein
MKKDWINEMRKTERLKLSFNGFMTHYLIVLFLFIPLILVAFDFFRLNILDSYNGVRTPQEMFRVSIPFGAMGILFFFIQYNRLRFKVVETVLSREKLQEIIFKTAKELEWFPVTNTTDLIVSKTNPKWWTGSWGEQITIIFDKDKVLINSICDPDRKSSVVSVGRNKRNVNKLIDNIKNASR